MVQYTQMTDWQQQLKDAITSPEELLDVLGLPHDQFDGWKEIAAAHQQFSLRVPRAFVEKMKLGDPADPLLRQVLTQQQEMQSVAGYTQDPLGEMKANPLPGLLHKYKTRALLTLAAGCAINCRYCFRRHFPYGEQMMDGRHQQSVIHYFQEHPAINEVILSGGDPLMVKDDRLASWIDQLESVKSLIRLRIHTRFPVVIPERITPQLVNILNSSRLKVIMVLHINHPNEIDDVLATHLASLVDKGVLLFNQTVLLKGVNDETSILTALSEALFKINVLPYYLHCLDKVQGAAHFDVPRQQALALYQSLQAELPGFLVPKLVEECAGEKHKTLIGGL